MNRAQHWIDNGYDVAFITAWRQVIDDVTENTKEVEDGVWEGEPIELDFKENQRRNKELVALLRSLGFGVTTFEGYFSESAEVGYNVERSLFVVNLKGSDQFKSVLMNASEYYNQYSFIMKEGSSDQFVEYFTNTCDGHKVGEEGMRFDGDHVGDDGFNMAFTRIKNKKLVLDPVKDSNMCWGFAQAQHNYASAKKAIDRMCVRLGWKQSK